MLNHIVLMGRLTRDPELRRTQSGVAVASFSLAVDRDFQSRDGGEKQTDFIDIVAWRNTAEQHDCSQREGCVVHLFLCLLLLLRRIVLRQPLCLCKQSRSFSQEGSYGE